MLLNQEITENTHFRLLEVEDVERIITLLDQSRNYLREWLPSVDDTSTPHYVEKFIRSGLQKYADNNGAELGAWPLGELVGVIGLRYIK